jgi:hypothetical protein
MNEEQRQHPTSDKFSDQEMDQVKRYGEALGSSSEFSDEVEKELEKRGAYQRHQEAGTAKMRAAQTAGSTGLGQLMTCQAVSLHLHKSLPPFGAARIWQNRDRKNFEHRGPPNFFSVSPPTVKPCA